MAAPAGHTAIHGTIQPLRQRSADLNRNTTHRDAPRPGFGQFCAMIHELPTSLGSLGLAASRPAKFDSVEICRRNMIGHKQPATRIAAALEDEEEEMGVQDVWLHAARNEAAGPGVVAVPMPVAPPTS